MTIVNLYRFQIHSKHSEKISTLKTMIMIRAAASIVSLVYKLKIVGSINISAK